MQPDRNSPEYERAAAQAKKMLGMMQICFMGMQACMRMDNYFITEAFKEKPDTTVIDKVQKESMERVQATINRFLDNDKSSPGFEIITAIAKALSEEFLMDYFAEQKKHASEPVKS